MSNATAERLRKYVQGGGNIFSTFETSLYDETGMRRKDFALAELMGVQSNAKIVGPMRWDFMKPAATNSLLNGLDRALIPSSTYHVQVTPQGTQPLLFFTKPLAGRYDGTPQVSSDPALLVKPTGSGTSVYFSGDLGASIEAFHVPELLRLVANAGSDFAPRPVVIEGAPGSVEVVLRTQGDKRSLLHLVNFTGEMTRPMQHVVPINDIIITLPDQFRSARTLYHSAALKISTTAKGTRIILPKLEAYEVVVLEK